MKLTILSHAKNFDGLIDVDSLVDGKVYSFVLSSENDLEEVQKLIHRKRPGTALNLMKKRNYFLRQ